MSASPRLAALLGLGTLALASPAAGQSVVHGTVRTDSANPVANAELVLRPTLRTTLSSPTGTFTFGTVRPGRYQLIARAIGYEPESTVVTPRGSDTVDVTLELRRRAQVLEPVEVTTAAPATSPQMREFESRRGAGRGRFLTRAELAKRE